MWALLVDLRDCVRYSGAGRGASRVRYSMPFPSFSGFEVADRDSIYVGYPNIAQGAIDQATLVITSQTISNPTPDTVDVSLTSQFITDSSRHPDLKAFNASLYLEGEDTPFVFLDIPAVPGAKNGTEVQVDQRNTQIWNDAAFAKYCETTLASEEYTVFLTGSGGLQQGELPNINVNYNNTVVLKGTHRILTSDRREAHSLCRSEQVRGPYSHQLLSALGLSGERRELKRPRYDSESFGSHPRLG